MAFGIKVLLNQDNGSYLRFFSQSSNILGKDFSIIETPFIGQAQVVGDDFDVASFNKTYSTNYKITDRGYL